MEDSSASILPGLQELVTYRNVNVVETLSESDTSSIAETIVQPQIQKPMARGAPSPRIPGLSIYDQDDWRQQNRGSSPTTSPSKSPLPKRRKGNGRSSDVIQTTPKPRSFLDTITPAGAEANTLNDTAQRAGLRMERPQYRLVGNGDKHVCILKLISIRTNEVLFETGSKASHGIAATNQRQAKVNAVRLAMSFVDEFTRNRPAKLNGSRALSPARSRPPTNSSSDQPATPGAANSSLPPAPTQTENWIGIIYEYCQSRRRPVPTFMERANADYTEFTCLCNIVLPEDIQLALYTAITIQSKVKKTRIVTFGSTSDVYNTKVEAKRAAARTAVIALMAAGEKVIPPGAARLKNLFGIFNGPKEDTTRSELPIRSHEPEISRTAVASALSGSKYNLPDENDGQQLLSDRIKQGNPNDGIRLKASHYKPQAMSPAHPQAQAAASVAGTSRSSAPPLPEGFRVPRVRERLPVTEAQITDIINSTAPLNKRVLDLSELLALPAPQFQWTKEWPIAYGGVSETDGASASGSSDKEPLISGGAVFRGLEKDKRISDGEVRWLTGLIGEVRHEKGLPVAREKSGRLVLGVLKRIALDRVEEDKLRAIEDKAEAEARREAATVDETGKETEKPAEAEAEEEAEEEEELLISMDD